MTPGPRRTMSNRPNAATAVELAQRIGHAMLPLAAHPGGRLLLMLTVARGLRDALCRERERGEATDTPTSVRIERELAHAVESMTQRGSPIANLADLRLLGRLTLAECADLLGQPHDAVTRLWRNVRPALFAAARLALTRPHAIQPDTEPR